MPIWWIVILAIYIGTCLILRSMPFFSCTCLWLHNTLQCNLCWREFIVQTMSMSASKPSGEHASERLLKLGTDFKDNVCSTDVIAPEEKLKLNDCSKYESAFCRPIQKSASIRLAHLFSENVMTLKFTYVASTLPWNPGHLASRGWSCRDAGQHGTNPGHPGKSRRVATLGLIWTGTCLK